MRRQAVGLAGRLAALAWAASMLACMVAVQTRAFQAECPAGAVTESPAATLRKILRLAAMREIKHGHNGDIATRAPVRVKGLDIRNSGYL
jgi:hypothetical protein